MTQNSIDYNLLFEKVERIKKALLIAVGRAGSDFFHSLLDEHPQILQIPGSWNFHEFWNMSICKDNLDDFIQEFIWNTAASKHIVMFKSKYHVIERWDQLGENKNESFEVDIETFAYHLKGLLRDKELNSKNMFIAVHIAYGLSIGIDVSEAKLLFYNIHHVNKLHRFNNDFKSFDVIAMIRYPINTITSSVNHYIKNKPETSLALSLGSILKRIFDETRGIECFTQNTVILKLEDLHSDPNKALGLFCEKYDLNFEESLLNSTFGGKKWWGDKISGKFLDGFNPAIYKDKGKGNFWGYDRFMIESILNKRMDYHGYKPKYTLSKNKLAPLIVALLILLPMRLEVRVFIFNLRKSYNLNHLAMSIIFSTVAYIKRVTISYKYLIKSFRSIRYDSCWDNKLR